MQHNLLITTFKVLLGSGDLTQKQKMPTGLLPTYSRALEIIIAGLLIVLGLQLFFVGLKDVSTLITMCTVLLIAFGVKIIIDVILRSIMGKELEKIIIERE